MSRSLEIDCQKFFSLMSLILRELFSLRNTLTSSRTFSRFFSCIIVSLQSSFSHTNTISCVLDSLSFAFFPANEIWRVNSEFSITRLSKSSLDSFNLPWRQNRIKLRDLLGQNFEICVLRDEFLILIFIFFLNK